MTNTRNKYLKKIVTIKSGQLNQSMIPLMFLFVEINITVEETRTGNQNNDCIIQKLDNQLTILQFIPTHSIVLEIR
jgi:hypothetical protein